MRLTIILTVAAAGLGLAACGSSSSNSSNPSTSAAGQTTANSGKSLAFSRCMRSHGVSNFPDPPGNGQLDLRIQQTPDSTSVNGVEVNGPAFQSAMQACHGDLPNGGHPSAAQTARAKAQAFAMSRCMRSHGVPNFPDPQFQSGPGGGIGVRIGGSGIDPSSPAFQAAQRACGSIFGGLKATVKAPG